MIRGFGSAMQRGSQLMNYNFMIYKTINYFASQGFESLMTQISQSTNAQNVMDLFNQHKGLYNNEHIILTARTLGRLSKSLNTEIMNEQEFRTNYAELTQRVEAIMGELNEFDLLDVLFWLRRCKINKYPLNISHDTYMILFRRIGEYVQQQVYSFRNLVNIYYDMCMLDKYWDYAPDFLLRSIKDDPSQITQFTSMQILQAVSKRADRLTNKEAILADIVIRNIQPILDDFDYDQKANLFKYISKLECHFQFPTFRIPQALYTLRDQLLEKLDKLSEQPVTNIIQAYQNLPSYFPADLLDEIIDMVIVTLQHNSENLKTTFLINFTDAVTQIQRRPLDQAKLNTIIQELSKRLEAIPDEKQQIQQAEKMVSILNRLPRDQMFSESVYKIAKQVLENNFWIPVGIIEYLCSQKEKMVVLTELINVDQSLQLNNSLKIRLLISILRSNPGESELINKLKENIEAQVAVNPYGILLSQENINGFNNSYLKQLNTRAIERLTQDLTDENFFKHFKAIFISIQDYSQRLLWVKFLEGKQFNKRSINRLIDDFELYNKNNYNSENINFFLSILLKHIEFVAGYRLIQMICAQNRLCSEISRNDSFLRKIVQILIQIKEKRNNEIRLSDIAQLIMRFEQNNNRSNLFKRLLKKIFDLQKTSSEDKLQWDSVYIQMLIKYKCLPIDLAARYLENLKTNDLNLKVRLLGLAQQTEGGLEKYQEQQQSILDEIKDRLKSDQVSKQLNAVVGLLNLHPSSFQGLEEQMQRIVVENTNKINDRFFLQLLTAIQPKWFKLYELRQSYAPIVKELISIHSNKRIQFCDNILVMEHFNLMNVKSPQLFNSFLTECGNNFEFMLVEQRVRILNIFASASIKQQDFFQKNLERIRDFNRQYQTYLQDISSSIFRVGLDDQVNVDIYLELINKQENYNDVDRLYILQTACMMGAPVEFLSKILNGLRNESNKYFGAPRFLQPIVDYLRLVGLDDGSLKIKKIMEEIDQTYEIPNYKTNFATLSLIQYLQAMKIQIEVDKQVQGQQIDIYIAAQQCIIQLVSQQQQNLFQDSFNGRTLLKYKTLKMIKDHKVILIPLKEFSESGYNHMDKINYLLSKGIIAQVGEGQYDFSHIKARNEKQQQVVKEEEEEVVVEETVDDEGDIKE